MIVPWFWLTLALSTPRKAGTWEEMASARNARKFYVFPNEFFRDPTSTSAGFGSSSVAFPCVLPAFYMVLQGFSWPNMGARGF